MVFSSIIFICIFLPVMIIGYYVLPKKFRNLFLLLGSLFFYAWGEPKYIILMLASIAGNYIFGMLIHYFASMQCCNTGMPKAPADFAGQTSDAAISLHPGTSNAAIQPDTANSTTFTDKSYDIYKKVTLIITIVFNIGLLVYFKYFMLIMTVVHDVFNDKAVIPEIALPIGISFFTFQGMSYVIDVYRHDCKPDDNGKIQQLVQKNPINLALYISMFPQLIAGPIVRYGDIKDYLKERHTDVSKFARGIERFIIGLSKKAIIANSLGEVADKIFNYDVNLIGTSAAWLGAILFTLQIYFDFSGYSDMAIGLGRMFGFEFMENFNYPYISKSLTEFWRRWHISLSTWFRDYLYIPLGGNRKGNVYVHLFIVFLATGIWHGAAWGYLAWGIWHGIFVLIERVFRKKNIQIRVSAPIKWLYTMLVVTVGFAIFKIEELPQAMSYLGIMFHVKPYDFVAFSLRYYLDNKVIFILIVAILVCIPWKEVLCKLTDARQGIKNQENAAVRSNKVRQDKSYQKPASAAQSTRIHGTGIVCVLSASAAFIIKRILLAALFILSFVFIVNSTYNPFIYFRF